MSAYSDVDVLGVITDAIADISFLKTVNTNIWLYFQ